MVEEQIKTQTELCKVQAVINQQNKRLAKAHNVQVLGKLNRRASLFRGSRHKHASMFKQFDINYKL